MCVSNRIDHNDVIRYTREVKKIGKEMGDRSFSLSILDTWIDTRTMIGKNSKRIGVV